MNGMKVHNNGGSFVRKDFATLQDVFRPHARGEFLGHLPQKWLKGGQYLLNILLVHGKKSLTRKWFINFKYMDKHHADHKWNYLWHAGKSEESM